MTAACALATAFALTLIAFPFLSVDRALAASTCAAQTSGFSFRDGDLSGGVFRSGADGLATVGFQWQVDPNANPGDSFTVRLPDELVSALSTPIDLKNERGELVATGTWAGKTATFRLSDYAADHGHISGSAYFSVKWDRAVVSPSGGNYDLSFTGCKGSGTLRGEYLAEGAGGAEQADGKTGILDEPNGVRWSIFVETASSDVYAPLSITDEGGIGFVLSCANMRVYNRTPQPGVLNDQEIARERWTCAEDGRGGFSVTFHPLSDGRYAAAGESLMLSFDGTTTPAVKELSSIVNRATITGGPKGESRKVEGIIRIPTAGGEGSGHQATFSILKKTEGDAPAASTEYAFEYTCRGGDFVDLDAVTAGSRTRAVTTHSAAVCDIREKDLTEGASVAFTVEGAASEPIDRGVRIRMNKGVDSVVSIVATNTFPAKPEEPTPSEPEDPTPSEPENPTPSEPEEPTPSEPENPTPSEPENPTPSEPEEPTPSEPEEPTPSEPENPTPSEPENPTPSTPEPPKPSTPEPQRVLAKTGMSASVIPVIVLASLAGGVFTFASRRRRD
ncbi:Ig-like domain-containing protein [Schaalia hyovaginalis]|uniref:Ig-like domain-containing protein n=1 Tax=Schaalia hyovaginalis TaxID=29316 RepID=UPI002A819212|nr:Ig-like domain-containing protein [Schaalia hyovaginalis]MDY4492379.1 Ig-like domain-containing protein [Schaalia hyovaginalis]MDY5506581.1 Ig-like domain-containing protein [Schaalia hyovaginalis]